MNHSFNVELATEVGTNASILLENIFFWCTKNKSNNKNFFDGFYWTYNSAKAFCELFPYMSQKQIYTALKKLEELGYIKTGCYNTNSYDHTKWYAITLKGESIYTKSQIEETKQTHHITDNKPDNKPVINKSQVDTCSDAEPENTAEAIECAELLYTLHKREDEKYNVSKQRLKAWATDIDKLHRLDGRDWEEIKEVIEWAKAPDCFWFPNIMSGKKLREKFATLLGQMKRPIGKNAMPFMKNDVYTGEGF